MLPATNAPALPALSDESMCRAHELEHWIAEQPGQIHVVTDHLLHGGMYHRTCCIPAGAVVSGCLVKIATTLMVSGHCRFYVGDDAKLLEVDGYAVLPGFPGRKSTIHALADTHMTMIFPTTATTVAEAEAEFTDEADRLMSRSGERDTVRTTGGMTCPD